ncbi:hypothetical protein M4R22_07655 [Acidovorax sp. GBBC 3334]|uniref:hypothetical protein n=1 Tax=Acidovorax sp. GBBC 3334 TaxID=2940496 RepID=UPI00230498E5|nr:hypothetical protein [Acidovorax sp. GBBC 3334]MDA8454634.1 hypothetical protein [Acidovorax sp. GBBC 3334]
MRTNFKLPAILAILLLIAIAAGFISYRSDAISEQKASSMIIIQTLSPTRNAADRCWTEKNISATECKQVTDNLSKIKDSHRIYFISDQGLIGIDHEHQNLIILTPEIKDGHIAWKCSGHPEKALPKSCTSVISSIQRSNDKQD